METNDQPQTGNRPISHVRIGPIEASIWRNDGQNGAYHTVSFERRYRDSQSGEWRSARSFRSSDLLSLLVAGFQAYQTLADLESGETQ